MQPGNKKILVVDNHPLLLKFMVTMLEKRRHHVFTAADAPSALNILEETLPDVIFIDLVMPNIDGEKLCRIIRNMSGFQDVPIIILSAIAAEEEVDFTGFGADACIAKGPLPEMRVHILKMIDQLDEGVFSSPDRKIRGSEGMIQRTITRELLLVKKHFEAILCSMSEGILEIDEGARIVYANPTAISMFEMSEEELLVSNLLDWFTYDDRERVREMLSEVKRSPDRFSTGRLLNIKGREVTLQALPIQGETPNNIIILDDVTDRMRMETQIRNVQKMEAIGTLASGIAHDFNNFLMAILGSIELAKVSLESGTEVMSILREAEKATFRATGLTRQLITFAKGGEPIIGPADIKELLRTTADFALAGSNVIPSFSIPDDIRNVDVDAGQIEQVITNLVINAKQAMPEGGRVFLSLKNLESGADKGVDLDPGPFVECRIRDEGIGIGGDSLSKIFDPYYTTKQTGSGLGLATAYSIIRKHKGHISVDSKVGEGTVLTFLLPASNHALVEQNEADAKMKLKRGLNVLVMDDDDMVARALTRMLERLGCQVTKTDEGGMAIDTYQGAFSEGKFFDAVILDLTVQGGLGGKEAAAGIKAVDPSARLIISSGYSEGRIMSRFREYGFCARMKKPYTLSTLVDTLNRIL